jgi:hypothetical protein
MTDVLISSVAVARFNILMESSLNLTMQFSSTAVWFGFKPVLNRTSSQKGNLVFYMFQWFSISTLLFSTVCKYNI